MRKSLLALEVAAVLLCLAAALWAVPSEIDDQLTARRRVFSNIGAGLRAVRQAANGNYYVLASPSVGVAIFDSKGKQLSVIGAPPEAPVTDKAGRSPIGKVFARRILRVALLIQVSWRHCLSIVRKKN